METFLNLSALCLASCLAKKRDIFSREGNRFGEMSMFGSKRWESIQGNVNFSFLGDLNGAHSCCSLEQAEWACQIIT